MKKVISVFLALVIGFSMFCVNAGAASYKVKFSFDYESGYTYVTLKSTAGTTVYYTTDGTKADKNDKKYTGKLKVTRPVTLKLTVYSGNKAVKSYTAKVPVRVKTPVVSVTTTSDNRYKYTFSEVNGANIYYTVNGSTPSKTNGKKLGSSNSITVEPGSVVRAVAVKNGWKNSKVLKKTAPETASVEKTADTKEARYVDEVIRFINVERKKAGLSEFVTNDKLNRAAETRAKETTVKYDHVRPDGKTCYTALTEHGIAFSTAAENIAAGQPTPEDVVKAWMDSSGHRKNILNPKLNKMGVGYCEINGGYRYYWAQMFTN